MIKKFYQRFLMIMSLFYPFSSFAYFYRRGFEAVSENVIEYTSMITQIMYAVCYIMGSFFLFKAYEAYKGHQFKPEFTGISHTLFAATFGIALLLLPLIHHLLD